MFVGTNFILVGLFAHNFPALGFEWGRTFTGLESKNVELDCLHRGKPMCCSAITPRSKRELRATHNPHCLESITYRQSRYEIEQFEKVDELMRMNDLGQRKFALLDFIVSDEQIKKAKIWLAQVRTLMTKPGESGSLHDAKDYLSEFMHTRKCPGKKEEIWVEHIEPLSIHIRHPFAFETLDDFKHILKHDLSFKNAYKALNISHVGLINNDHILLSPGHRRLGKKYMFDAGTSSFTSSLFWFVCGFGQMGINFDQIFGWEMTLLEPNSFWDEVPSAYKPLYHFYNVPVSGNSSHDNSPLKMIKQIATTHDFVAFKLDVDTPGVELPIAFEILSDRHLNSFIDEFFFEFHFQDEFLAPPGEWNKLASYGNFSMTRKGIMNFFLDLRKTGVRAHYWP